MKHTITILAILSLIGFLVYLIVSDSAKVYIESIDHKNKKMKVKFGDESEETEPNKPSSLVNKKYVLTLLPDVNGVLFTLYKQDKKLWQKSKLYTDSNLIL